MCCKLHYVMGAERSGCDYVCVSLIPVRLYNLTTEKECCNQMIKQQRGTEMRMELN